MARPARVFYGNLQMYAIPFRAGVGSLLPQSRKSHASVSLDIISQLASLEYRIEAHIHPHVVALAVSKISTIGYRRQKKRSMELMCGFR